VEELRREDVAWPVHDKQGAPVWIARDRRTSWDVLWPELVRLG